MRSQFYASRGLPVPDDQELMLGLGIDGDSSSDEHTRALEEQWIEGDLTQETATVTEEGEFTSALRGILVGFFYPIFPFLWYRELPHPNWWEPLEPERPTGRGGDSNQEEGYDSDRFFTLRGRAGGDWLIAVVFSPRMQVSGMDQLFCLVLGFLFHR